eukprot:GHVP01038836.1.p1 GENE.GHVP01038836.1~~GHVP01038836.1.p1  ORF type:complete len:200 (+),score=15.66 GHVP01038836.1:136-735(+)
MASREITAFNTPFGLFQYTRIPQGFINSGAYFQKAMDEVFPRHLDWPTCYIDDLLIHALDFGTLLFRTKSVLERLYSFGLSVNFDKSQLGVRTLTYLGFHVDGNGISPTLDRVKTIINYPPPKDPTEVRRFVGVMNFYRPHLPHLAELLIPLHDLLRKKALYLERREREELHCSKGTSGFCQSSQASLILLLGCRFQHQ